MTERNIELLTRVRDLIQTEPDKHNQALWAMVPADDVTFEPGQKTAVISCPTACCVAGHAAMLSGDLAVVNIFDSTTWKGKTVYSAVKVQTPEGDQPFVENRAQELLGLTSEEAEYLFLPDWSRDYVLEMLNTLIAGDELDTGDDDYYDEDDD